MLSEDKEDKTSKTKHEEQNNDSNDTPEKVIKKFENKLKSQKQVPDNFKTNEGWDLQA